MTAGPGNTVLLVQLKRIGDVLLCTPLVRALRVDNPDRRILFMTEEPNRDLLRGNPAIDEIITIPDPEETNLGGWLKFLGRLRRERIETVIDLSGTPRSCFLTFACGARLRVGFPVRLPRKWAYNKIVFRDESKYTVDRRLDLVRSLGIEDRGFAAEIHLDEEDRDEARRLLEAAGFGADAKPLAVAPTSRKEAKRWPAEGFARIAEWARDELGAEVLLLSGYGEEEQEEQVRSRLAKDLLRLPEIPRLRVLAALLERSRMLLANDGGPKHLAVAFGIPTVTVFVSTAAASWHPPNDDNHIAVQASGDLIGDIAAVKAAIRGVWGKA